MHWISVLFYVVVVASALRWRWIGAVVSATAAAALFWLLVLQGNSTLNNWIDVPLFFGCGALTVALGGRAHLEIAFRDPETSLPNGAWLRERLNDEMRRASRDSGADYKASALLIVGIDGWKNGEEANGEKLRVVAQVIRGAIRTVDLAARLHDQEFAVLLPETDEPGARIVAERIRRAVDENYTYFKVSVGVVEIENASYSADELLHCADEAMFEARRLGGNRVVFYDAEMHGL